MLKERARNEKQEKWIGFYRRFATNGLDTFVEKKRVRVGTTDSERIVPGSMTRTMYRRCAAC